CVRGERRRATPRPLGAGAGSAPRPVAIVATRQVAARATSPGRPSLPAVAFRGARVPVADVPAVLGVVLPRLLASVALVDGDVLAVVDVDVVVALVRASAPTTRSEEHTSELQSRFDLVCRLLLEK